MSWLWLLFASLTVIGSVAFNVGMKVGTSNVNPLGFMLVMNICIFVMLSLCCLIASYGFKVTLTQGLTPHALKWALVCGCSAALIDIGYILAVRYGSMISTQVFWTVGGMTALCVFAVLFMGETMTWAKALGVAFGIASVLLITKAP